MMSTFMKRYAKTMALATLFAVAFTVAPAYADGGVFSTIIERMMNAFNNVRNVVFVMGGFGLIGLGVAAIFGKVRWPWLAALAAGLATVAIAGSLVDYVTSADGGGDGYDKGISDKWEDTLTGSGS